MSSQCRHTSLSNLGDHLKEELGGAGGGSSSPVHNVPCVSAQVLCGARENRGMGVLSVGPGDCPHAPGPPQYQQAGPTGQLPHSYLSSIQQGSSLTGPHSSHLWDSMPSSSRKCLRGSLEPVPNVPFFGHGSLTVHSEG